MRREREACPHCGGRLMRDRLETGLERCCLNCGYIAYAEADLAAAEEKAEGRLKPEPQGRGA